MINTSQRKLGIVLQYLQMGLSILISFIYTPIMLNKLGQAEYGIYNLASSIISYLSLFSLGFGASYIRFYSRYKKDNDEYSIKRLNGLFLIVFLILGSIALACGVVLSFNVHVFFNETYTRADMDTAKILMLVLSINLATSFPFSVFTSYITAQEKFVFQKLLNIVRTVVGPFLTLPALLLGYGSIGMVVVTTSVSLLADIVNIIFCVFKLKMRFSLLRPDFKLLKEIAGFSFFIALNQIIDQINWNADKIILGKVCTSAAVAIYAIGAQINTYYLSFSTAISNVYVPRINQICVSDEEESLKNDQLTELFIRVGRVQFIVMALILTGFIFFGEFFILKWAGAGYENAYYIVLLLICPVTIPLIQNVGIEIQRAKNKHKFRGLIYLVMALINVGISIWFAFMWGEIGVAIGTTISLLLVNGLVMNIYYHKAIKINVVKFWKEILKFIPALVLPVAAGICLMLFYRFNGLWDFIGLIFAYAAIYMVSMYFFGLNKDEKGQIKRLISKLKRKKENDSDNEQSQV